MQVPESKSDSVLPETEQTAGVVEEKVTGRPELAVAERVSCVPAYCLPAMGEKAMVWETKETAKLCPVVAAA